MDIQEIVSTAYEEVSPEMPVSKLAARLADPATPGVLVSGNPVRGVLTARQLLTAQHQPGEKVRSLIWPVPEVDPTADVRRVAELLLGANVELLPVVEGGTLRGVVTAAALIDHVQKGFEGISVGAVASEGLLTLSPEATFGEAVNLLREQGIGHVPIVEDDRLLGMVSLPDLMALSARSVERSQGGDPGGTDSFGGPISDQSGRSRGGGFGAKEGERARMLDLPLRNLMDESVPMIEPTAPLSAAVSELVDGRGALVVGEDTPEAILTREDVLAASTRETEGGRAVQVYNTDLLDDCTIEDVRDRVEALDAKDSSMTVFDARVHLQKHDERLRGTPLLLARIRLFTDRGILVADGEGYGARHALNEAADVIERQIRDRKSMGRSKKPRDEAFWEQRFGWSLEGE